MWGWKRTDRRRCTLDTHRRRSDTKWWAPRRRDSGGDYRLVEAILPSNPKLNCIYQNGVYLLSKVDKKKQYNGQTDNCAKFADTDKGKETRIEQEMPIEHTLGKE